MSTGHVLTTDSIVTQGDKVLLIKRGNEPCIDMWALPGGKVDLGETVEHACIRELKEETNLDGRLKKLVGVFSDPSRSPRGKAVSVAYEVEVEDLSLMKAGDDAVDIQLTADWRDMDIAFDHKQILEGFFVSK